MRPAPASGRSLAYATLAALAVAAVVLVVAILPAEYGVDPTGIGRATGLTRLAPSTPGEPAEDVPAPPGPATSVTLRTYVSSFPTSGERALDLEGYAAEGETRLVPVTLDLANVTRVTARLEFVDANETAGGRTRPDTFEIELKAPHGDVTGGVLARSDPATGGGLAIATFQARQPPHPRETEAADVEGARGAFGRLDPPDRSFAGEWSVRVTLVEAGDGEVGGVPLGAAPGPAADAGNAWRLIVSVESYRLEIAEKPGTNLRQDVVELTIPPKGELEYKLLVNFGARVDYTWTAQGGEAYFDFHGERSDDPGGPATRHKSGTAASDTGALVAPFDGRHGWYWRNAGDSAVTLKLETRGAYEVIGRV